jgi:hypothetical protein
LSVRLDNYFLSCLVLNCAIDTVISGEETYTFANGDAGYALVLTHNSALRSLAGFASLGSINGNRLPAHARIRIQNNANLCYLDTVGGLVITLSVGVVSVANTRCFLAVGRLGKSTDG